MNLQDSKVRIDIIRDADGRNLILMKVLSNYLFCL